VVLGSVVSSQPYLCVGDPLPPPLLLVIIFFTCQQQVLGVLGECIRHGCVNFLNSAKTQGKNITFNIISYYYMYNSCYAILSISYVSHLQHGCSSYWGLNCSPDCLVNRVSTLVHTCICADIYVFSPQLLLESQNKILMLNNTILTVVRYAFV
jgi:hypothetical protein